MIHIVFQEADIDVLKKAIELDETLAGDILQVKDDFAVGPLSNLDEAEDREVRMNWWKELLAASPYHLENMPVADADLQLVEQLKTFLDENEKETAWIWMGQNQHDVCGYYWLMAQLKEYQGRIFVLYLNNLPFINEKGLIFYPTALHQVRPSEFLKAKKLCRKITTSEFEVDPDEWKKLCNENSVVRVLEGGKKIVGKEEDFYDKDIIAGLSKEWQKGNRAMNSILSKMKFSTGDVFILWRMQKLAQAEKIEINGDPAKGWKEFEVRVKSAAEETVPENQTTI
jgi:hypothetical protein